MLEVMNTDKTISGSINLGNPDKMVVLKIAELICSKIGSSSTLTIMLLPPNDRKQRRPNIEFALKIFDFITELLTREVIKKCLIANLKKYFYNDRVGIKKILRRQEKMVLSNLYDWNKNTSKTSVSSACGTKDKGTACGSGDKKVSACGAGDKRSKVSSACGAESK